MRVADVYAQSGRARVASNAQAAVVGSFGPMWRWTVRTYSGPSAIFLGDAHLSSGGRSPLGACASRDRIGRHRGHQPHRPYLKTMPGISSLSAGRSSGCVAGTGRPMPHSRALMTAWRRSLGLSCPA